MRRFFRKPDEMERAIFFRAQRNAYFFLVAALLVWSFWESFQVYLHNTRLNLLPCLLLAAAALIQGFSELILKRNAVKDDPDSWETRPMIWIVSLLCALAGAVVSAAAVVLLLAVRT